MTMQLIYHAPGGDISLNEAGLMLDNSWFTMVYIMLFTHRRANDDDILPDPFIDRQGWPGDSYFDYPIGSRLWLLAREKRLTPVLYKARDYALEALTTLIDIKMARTVEVTTRFTHQHWLQLDIAITAVNNDEMAFSFSMRWEEHQHAVSYTESGRLN